MTVDCADAILNPGDRFRDRLFCVSHVEDKKGNGPDLKMILSAGGQRHTAKKWTVPDDENALVKESQFLLVSGAVDKGGSYEGEITIDTIKPVPADQIPQDMEPYLPARHCDHHKHIGRFDALVESIKHQALKELLSQFFSKDERWWPQFCEACAAAKMHHAYRGGLLHHSVEVAELCAATCQVIPTLNRDLLVTCALLHDIGKMREMEHGLNAGLYTDPGILTGHVVLGAIMVRPLMDGKRIKGFSEGLREAVTHMILSHHGTHEFGAPQLPAFPEAFILAQCDLTSARFCQYQTAMDAKQPWLSGRDGGVRLYTGPLGLAEAEYAD